MIFSLQRRFLVFLLLPVTLVLLTTGVVSFFHARSYILDQWREQAKLRLEKTAHQIQMRLDSKREMIGLIAAAEDTPDHAVTQAFLIQRLADQPGVSMVNLEDLRADRETVVARPPTPPRSEGTMMRMDGTRRRTMRGMGSHMRGRGSSTGSTAPRGMHGMMRHSVDVALDPSGNFLSIAQTFGGAETAPAKRIVAYVAFASFMKGILEAGQWEESQASLVKSDGTFLAHTGNVIAQRGGRLGATGDPLEQRVLREMQERHFGTVFGEGSPPDRIIGFYKAPSTNWFLVLSSPGAVILAPIVRFQLNYALLGAAALLITALLLRWNTAPVAKAVGDISEASARVEQGDYSVHVDEGRSDEVGVLARSFNRMTEGLRKRELIERTFGRYVDKDVAEDLLNRPEALRLGGEKRTVTILMADLRDFTPISDRLQPEQVIKIVNRHFSRMIEVIHHYRGIIVDFYGDSVLVFFDGGASDLSERGADAVRCAVDMMAQMKPQAEENRKEDLPEISMGIGVHTGDVIVGNIGSETRTKYGIVGSAVNETHRIQAEAAPGEIMISEPTYDLVKERVDVGAKCEACLKGFEGTRDLYRVLSVDGIEPPGK